MKLSADRIRAILSSHWDDGAEEYDIMSALVQVRDEQITAIVDRLEKRAKKYDHLGATVGAAALRIEAKQLRGKE